MKVRNPYVAGSFYPADRDLLFGTVNDFLKKAQEFKENFIAFVSPHAGYPYSGQTAAYVYKQIEKMKNVERIVLLGVSHNAIFDYIAIDGNDMWETPLGCISIDREIVNEFLKDRNFKMDSSPHDIEHSLEVQIPFIQVVKPDAKIIPLLMGSSDYSLIQKAAERIFEVYSRRNFLFIVSSDMYHGYSYEECKKYDERTKDAIISMDWKGFYNLIDKEVMACGAYAIAVLLKFCELLKDVKAKVLHQTNSADVTGSYYGYVVGYLSLGFYK